MLVTWQHTVHVGFTNYYAELLPKGVDYKSTPLKLQLTMHARVDHDAVDDITLAHIDLDWGTGHRQVTPTHEISFTDEMVIQDYMDGPAAYRDAQQAGHGQENLV
jgi:hypothetical protein